MKSLAGKVALITGAGRPKGMGRTAALKMAEQGASVVVTDVCRERKDLELREFGLTIGDNFTLLQRLVEEIRAAGGEGMAVAMDITDTQQIDNCVEMTCEAFGGIDILFNNAGVAIGVGPFLEIPDASWDLSWQVNVKGMMDLCRRGIPIMQARGGGSIINNSSFAGLTAMPGYSAYTTTKFAVIGLTKAIAAEFGTDNIRCNAICPGNILTDMGDAEVDFIAEKQGINREAALSSYGAAVSLGRPGKPEEVGDLVAFLAGPYSSFITGVAIPITGGMSMGI
jgi:NAD(P)-dependent dehydrogenase (short-subunit alcohol dehydrogenase family)